MVEDHTSLSPGSNSEEAGEPRVDAARDYIFITGRDGSFSYQAKFSVNGFEMFFTRDAKADNSFRLLRFKLLDQDNTLLYQGKWEKYTNIYKVVNPSDPLDNFYVDLTWKKKFVALGDSKFPVDLIPKVHHLDLFGERVIIRQAGRTFSASVPRSLLAKISLEKIVAILVVLRAGRIFMYS